MSCYCCSFLRLQLRAIIQDVSFGFMTSQWNSIVTSSSPIVPFFSSHAHCFSLNEPSSVQVIVSFNNSLIAREIVFWRWTSVGSVFPISSFLIDFVVVTAAFVSRYSVSSPGMKRNVYLILSYRSLVFSQASGHYQCSPTVILISRFPSVSCL